MYEIQMAKGAKKILEVCASVEPGEEVLIIADYNMEKIGKAIASAAFQIGAEPVLTYLVPRERDGQEPPKAVAEAMKAAGTAPHSPNVARAAAMAASAARNVKTQPTSEKSNPPR